MHSQDSQICQWQDCHCAGHYKAPKSKAELDTYLWFCLTHIRNYNASWDYFAGCSAEEIAQFQTAALTGHRPSQANHGSENPVWRYEKLLRKMQEVPTTMSLQETDISLFLHKLPAAEQQAIKTLDLQHPFSKNAAKKRFKELAKQYHPDINKEQNAHQQFQTIITAYNALLNSKYLADTTWQNQ